MEDERANVLRIDKTALWEAILQAFVESRFAAPHGARYVNIHANGTLSVSRTGLGLRQSGSWIIALECLGAPEFPGRAVPVGASWSRDEYLTWVSSRMDLYLDPALDELEHQAKRQGLRVEFIDHAP
ncbi:MAG: hypothetical protein JNL43_01510 [Flavobacteriales bacterium]|nr:hypothetical protein [Flavobacteriales bacterium]HRH71325.1 hypothetical protein [Flavobacteriales bacterium]